MKLNDPLQTWVYVDPRTSQVAAEIQRYNRLKHWLYSGLHKLDFRFLYDARPLWDVVMIALCAGGFILSGLGFYLGGKRIARSIRRTMIGLASRPLLKLRTGPAQNG